jgi:fructooligosaccharide transport system substrate-binding protein
VDTIAPEPADTEVEEAGDAEDDVVEIEFYFPEGFGREERYAAIIEAFEEKYPNIKVNVRLSTWGEFKKSLPIMWSSDNVADVVLTDGPDIQEYAYYGALLPLDDLFPESELEKYSPGVVEAVTYKGSIYGAPYLDNALAFYCNKDMFEAAGIEAPITLEDAWTFDEWLVNIQQVVAVAEEEQGRKIWGLVGINNPPFGSYWTMWIPRSAGEKGSPTFMGISEDGTELSGYLDTPESLAVLQFYQDLFQVHKLMPTADIPDAFETGQSACRMHVVSGGLVFQRDYPDLNWFVMPLPYFVTPLTHTGGFAPSVSARSAHPEEAKTFLRFLTKDEGLLLDLKAFPSLPGNLEIRSEIPELSGYAQVFLELNEQWGVARPVSPGHSIYDDVVATDMMLDIALGADVKTRVQQAIQDAEALLTQFKE